MYVIVVGGGEVGSFVARTLTEEGHEVVVVEPDEATADRLVASLDAMVIHGSGVSPEILEKAGITQANVFLAVTPSDEVNLVACMIARKRGGTKLRTVAQVKQAHYLGGGAAFTADDLEPVDALVHYERAITSTAMELLRFAGSGEIRELAGGKVVLLGMALGSDSPLVGPPLVEVAQDLPSESRVVAVQNADGIRLCTGTDRLAPDDRAFVCTLPEHLTELTILSGKPWFRVESVLVIGLGNTGTTLAAELERSDFESTLLELDAERAEQLAARFSKSTVIAGDACDPDLLRRILEDHEIDAVVVLLKDPERSLLIGLFAKSLGAKKVIVRCDRPAYGHMANKLGIDAIISKQRAVVNMVLRYVSRGNVEAAVMLGEHDLEVIDLRIPDAPANASILVDPIAKLGIPDGVTIGALVRGGKATMVRGDTVLKARDELILICRPLAVADVEARLA